MPNATLHLSRSSEGFKVKVTHVNLYPAAGGNPRFVAMNVEETIDRPGCYVTMGMLSIHAEKAAELDGLIGGLKRMRELLASAEAVEADNKRAAEAVPLAEALKDPAGFVAGMTETRATHRKVWLILSTGAGGFNGRYWSRSMNGGNGGWSEWPADYARFDSLADAKRVALAEKFRHGKYVISEAEYTEQVPVPAGLSDDPAAHSDSGEGHDG